MSTTFCGCENFEKLPFYSSLLQIGVKQRRLGTQKGHKQKRFCRDIPPFWNPLRRHRRHFTPTRQAHEEGSLCSVEGLGPVALKRRALLILSPLEAFIFPFTIARSIEARLTSYINDDGTVKSPCLKSVTSRRSQFKAAPKLPCDAEVRCCKSKGNTSLPSSRPWARHPYRSFGSISLRCTSGV